MLVIKKNQTSLQWFFLYPFPVLTTVICPFMHQLSSEFAKTKRVKQQTLQSGNKISPQHTIFERNKMLQQQQQLSVAFGLAKVS